MATTNQSSSHFSIFTPGKYVYSQCFPEYLLTGEDIRRLQNCLLGIFLDFKNLCDSHDIKYMMADGSLLGTVRHQGFIPWDDDIDVMMTRADYLRFREILLSAQQAGAFSEYLLAEPGRSEDYYFKLSKLYRKNTEYSQINYMGNPRYNMVGIDIFIIEYMPESRLKMRLNGLVFDFSFFASSFCLDYIFPSPVILEKCRENKALRKFYRFRRTMGGIFSLLGGIRFYLKLCRRLSEYPKKTTRMGIPCNFAYAGVVFDTSMFTETDTGMFCGYEVSIPRQYDAYLTNMYGDYMAIPREEDRVVHSGVIHGL